MTKTVGHRFGLLLLLSFLLTTHDLLLTTVHAETCTVANLTPEAVWRRLKAEMIPIASSVGDFDYPGVHSW
jgi:hypothetical protein